MGLLSFFKRSAANPPAPAAAPESIEQARTRARHRLIGAAVLVVIGVIGFPLLFETQPRPIPVDLPIEIPKRDGAPPLAVPAPRPAPAPAERREEVITESAGDAGREVATAPVAPTPAPAPTARPEPARPEPARPDPPRPEPRPAAPKPEPAKPTAPQARPTDAARAQALLEGRDVAKPAAAAEASSRFIVQVGAYSETSSARDMRQKVDKLGLKTYTQVVDTSAGKRIRVRVGPFASREEADRAAAKLKAAGLPSAVLTL